MKRKEKKNIQESWCASNFKTKVLVVSISGMVFF